MYENKHTLCNSANWWVGKVFSDKRKKNRKERKKWGDWTTSPERVSLKVVSKLPIRALLASARFCLCSPFQGIPGVLASIWCSQNALQCHLFKHSELRANREKPLFIKPLILAARMTTWLALKEALKSFIGMGGGNLYREKKGTLNRRNLWRTNPELRWGTVSSRGLMRQNACTMCDRDSQRWREWDRKK